MGEPKTSSYNLIELTNSLPDELLKASMVGDNEDWIAHKVSAINHYRKLPQISTKLKMWKKIAAIESILSTDFSDESLSIILNEFLSFAFAEAIF